MFIRAYLRASTEDQDAQRARADLDAFVAERGLRISSYYPENESGASLKRPELFRLLNDSHPGDVLLVEQVDRLSRLSSDDWDKLKLEIETRKVRVVALDLPTSWQMVKSGDEMMDRILNAMNGMLLDMLAAVARKDYTDRRRRIQQGIEKARAIPGKYKGRPAKDARNASILEMLEKGMSWSAICEATGCSRSHLSRLKQARDAQAAAVSN